VLLVARRHDELDAVAESIRRTGGSAAAVVCDVTDREQVEHAISFAADAFGTVDILVSNAGVTRDNLIHKMTDDDWNEVVTTHLTGAFLMSRATQRYMVAQRSGRIVLIGSTASAGSRGQVNYATAKAGLLGMARTLAIELGPFGVTVNVVSPGHVDSELTHSLADRLGVDYEEIRKDRIAVNAIKRVGVPEDVAGAVSFLASDEAGYITGQVLSVSGRPSLS
jgi:3-oxoacyl-[acyl-carrier protein] reductase